MAKEIERKFLVNKNNSWRGGPSLLKKVTIRQGYISKSPRHQLRVRVTDDSAQLTIKGPKKGIVRDEFEYNIPIADGEQLLKMSDTPILTKVRYYVRDNFSQLWEVDEYKGLNKGLVVAEIELESEKQKILHFPTWVGKEISRNKRYSNTYLVDHKVPTK